MKVALFLACYNDTLYPETGIATVRLLRSLGQDVDFPAAQTCCGQMHFNTGYRAEAAELMNRFVCAFDGYDAIVTPSASCAAMVRHHYPALVGTGRSATSLDRLEAVRGRTYELTEFLVDVLGVVDVGARFAHAVALHQTCHSLRALRIGDRPQRLLSAVDGLTLLTLPHADSCCGFGGTFSMKNEATSVAMGIDKVREIEASGAAYVTAADTSCLMHLGGLLSRRRSPIRTVHLAQILASGG